VRAHLDTTAIHDWPTLSNAVKSIVLNLQTTRRSRVVARRHYDLGNDLFLSFLDPYNQYSCAYFKETEDLNEAQVKKLKLIGEKLKLSSKDRVLDIGCGWGGLAKFAAETYGCHVTGISISDAQVAYATQLCRHLPVNIIKSDYREITGTFDKVVSCGMMEHVGHKNYRTLMKIVRRCLSDEGLFLLHTIGRNTTATYIDPWFHKYIFPNSVLPSAPQLTAAAEGLFVIEDWHNFGPYYSKTLGAWHRNFLRNWHLIENRYGETFRRMWEYYLLSCAGAFQARGMQLWQIVFSKEGILGGYSSIR
jgi:cyclopropane-fatty-acyl-phospholipid synthase